MTVLQKLGMILEINYFQNWIYQKMFLTKVGVLNWYSSMKNCPNYYEFVTVLLQYRTLKKFVDTSIGFIKSAEISLIFLKVCWYQYRAQFFVTSIGQVCWREYVAPKKSLVGWKGVTSYQFWDDIVYGQQTHSENCSENFPIVLQEISFYVRLN